MRLYWPIKGVGATPGIYIVQRFGEKKLDYTQFGMIAHNGLDIAAPKGTPIYASHDGQIDFYTEDPPGYGKNVRLFFEETIYKYELTYAHLERYEGIDRDVKVGDVIGYVDNTGFSQGNHLHFGIRRYYDGQVENYNNGYFGYFNPEPYLKKETFQVIYKKVGEATLYFSVGATLIPFATDYASYLKDFGDAVVVELPASEFAKFKISSLKVKI